MTKAIFETPDGDDIEIDSDDFVDMRPGIDAETTIIETDDGEEHVVVATRLEVIAELGLNPLEYVDPDDDDETLEEHDGDDLDDDE
ncbi:MAG: hypothetical protein JWQ16_306 [Novosphingobium sp.]|nr:hypothetical protein [Novosphingobium sp.]